MKEELTDKAFWLNYWKSKTDLIQEVPDNNSFSPVFDRLVERFDPKTAIELGGFPGHFCIYLKKRYQLDVSLFDYVIHPQILKDLLSVNKLATKDLHSIEGDIMNYQPSVLYDLVFSLGLIEHFHDTGKIIQRHLEFIKPGGILLISLPNFRGLNGWIQRTFDHENYLKHNIECMDIDYLKKICASLPLEDVEIRYFKSFSVWLENPEKKGPLLKIMIRILRLTGLMVFKILPLKTQFFSPYLIITAKKSKK